MPGVAPRGFFVSRRRAARAKGSAVARDLFVSRRWPRVSRGQAPSKEEQGREDVRLNRQHDSRVGPP